MLYSILTHLAYIANQVILSDLLVDKSLHGLVRHHSVASLIFMTSSITYDMLTLKMDGKTSFLQQLDVQNVHKNTRFSLNKSCGKFWKSVQDGRIVIDYEGFVLFFFFCVCRVEINLHWQLLVAKYITLCPGQS